MTPKERRRYAYDLRASGKTWAMVARELGVSLERTRQLVERYREDLRGPPEPRNELERWLLANERATSRTRKVLAEIEGEEDLAALSANGAAWLFKLPNIGAVTVRALAEGLGALGLVEDVDRWVAEGKKRARSLRGLRHRRRCNQPGGSS